MSRNFNDPEWDGEPEEPVPPGPGPDRPPEPPPEGGDEDDGTSDGPREKIVVKLADGKARTIQYTAATTYWSADGKPISAAEFLKRLFGDLAEMIADEDQLRSIWSDPDNRATFMERLNDRGYDRGRLNDIRRLVDAPDSDLFDVLSYVLFANPPKTRHERADGVRQGGMAPVDGELRLLLLGILQAYESHGGGRAGDGEARIVSDRALRQRERGQGARRGAIDDPGCVQANAGGPLRELRLSVVLFPKPSHFVCHAARPLRPSFIGAPSTTERNA